MLEHEFAILVERWIEHKIKKLSDNVMFMMILTTIMKRWMLENKVKLRKALKSLVSWMNKKKTNIKKGCYWKNNARDFK